MITNITEVRLAYKMVIKNRDKEKTLGIIKKKHILMLNLSWLCNIDSSNPEAHLGFKADKSNVKETQIKKLTEDKRNPCIFSQPERSSRSGSCCASPS